MKPLDIVVELRSTQRQIKFLSETNFESIISYADYKALPEERAIILMLALTGIKVSEILTLMVKNINLNQNTITILTRRRRKQNFYRTVPMHPNLKDAIIKMGLKSVPNAKVFNKSRFQIYNIVKEISKKVERENQEEIKIHPTIFRHTFIIRALSVGIPVNIICKWVGYTSLIQLTPYLKYIKSQDESYLIETIL